MHELEANAAYPIDELPQRSDVADSKVVFGPESEERSEDAGDLVVVDTAARKEVKRLPLGRMPEGILITPDGSQVFVAVNGDNNVAVVDPKTWTVARRISAGKGPDGLAWVR